MNLHAGWECRRRWPSASVARESSRALPGEARVQWRVGTGPLALPSTALTRPLGVRAPHSHVSAPPAASACLFSFQAMDLSVAPGETSCIRSPSQNPLLTERKGQQLPEHTESLLQIETTAYSQDCTTVTPTPCLTLVFRGA